MVIGCWSLRLSGCCPALSGHLWHYISLNIGIRGNYIWLIKNSAVLVLSSQPSLKPLLQYLNVLSAACTVFRQAMLVVAAHEVLTIERPTKQIDSS
jgi:hypothetical protein